MSTEDTKNKSPQTTQDLADAVIFAARRLVHGMRREGVPRTTAQNLHDQLARAVDAYEMAR